MSTALSGARLAERAIEPASIEEGGVGTETRLVGIELDRAEPARIAHPERPTVGEADAEPQPGRVLRVARVEQRVAGRLAVDDDPAAHAEMQAEHRTGGAAPSDAARVDEQLLAGSSRRDELPADERVTDTGRREPALSGTTRAGRDNSLDPAPQRACLENGARRLRFQ